MGDCPTSAAISEALADDPAEGFDGALGIVDPVGGAVGIPEIEFGQIAMKMLVATMLIDALHAPLENREITFDGIGMDRAVVIIDILIGTVPGWCRVPQNGT